MKRAAWDRPGERTLEERLASQPTQSRLIDILTRTSGNRAALRDSLAESCQRHLRATGGDHAARKVTIDVDSFPIQVHGHQPGAAYNGHYRETVYHPLLASYSVAGNYDSMQHGYRLGNGFVHAILRQGQVHTAQGIQRFLKEVVRKARGLGHVLDFRIDAGYTDGATLDFLTDEKLRFLGRLKSNAVLERLATPHLTRPVGRPPKEGYEVVIELGTYQAESWRHAQRLLLVIVDRPDPKSGQLNLLARLFLSRRRLEARRTRRSGGAGALSRARDVRGSHRRISASHRAASFARRLRRQRSPLAVVAVGLQSGVAAADRIRGGGRQLLRPGAISTRRAQGRRARK